MSNGKGGFIGQDGLNAPDEPTGITPTAGFGSVSVAFTAPSNVGASAITGFVAQTSNNDTDYSAGSNTGTSSPIVISNISGASTVKVWAINAFGTSSPSAASASFSTTGRALFMGSSVGAGGVTDTDYISIESTGNASDFGNLSAGSYGVSAISSSTRALGFSVGVTTDVIEYFTVASTGNSTDFGNMAAGAIHQGSVSNSTRAIVAGGEESSVTNRIQYVTFSTAGNTTDFGDLIGSGNTTYSPAPANSTTRGVFAGGISSDVIQYITMASTGNGTDFGNLSAADYKLTGGGNSTRGIFSGRYNGGSMSTEIQYISIASAGNTTDFGDLTQAISANGGTGNSTRNVVAGGRIANGSFVDTIDYITIATTGNATDFGNCVATKGNSHDFACNSAHGGIA
jgi:hypothetical protein